MNPDGTMHKFTPGQPLPQQAGNYTSGPQQQQQQAIYQTPQEWSLHSQVKHWVVKINVKGFVMYLVL